jgi:hypothetical protein
MEQTVIALENEPMTLMNSPVEDVSVIGDLDIPRKRHRRVPAKYCDTLPTSLPSLPETPMSRQAKGVITAPQLEVTRATFPGDVLLQTPPNIFGLFRRYRYQPSYDPDGEVTLEELAGFFTTSEAESPQDDLELLPLLCGTSTEELFYPFPNMSTFMLSEWYYNSPSGERSGPDFNRLVSVLSDTRFKHEDLVGFSAKVRDKLLDQGHKSVSGDLECAEIGGWRCNVPVTIQIPEGKHHWSNDEGRPFSVPGLHHHSITDII